jgi:curved DNA-binding protein CbpA
LEDYYAILGLDHGASQESIKLAYRRLARENHPDRNFDSTDAEKSDFSLHMAHLNGAYAVLSDPARRREYDEKLRIMDTLYGNTASRATATVAGSKPATRSNTSHRVQPSSETELTLVREFSQQLRSYLLANRKGYSWEEITLKGFDWGLEYVSWTSHYCVAGRGFDVLDPAAAKKFANYSEVAVSGCNRPLRKSHFLFLLPFQKLSKWESVSVEFNRLFSTENRGSKPSVPVEIVLFDSRRGRTMRVGNQQKEKHFEELLSCLGPELMHAR